ncbi:hypothetical protein B0H13DRAFT_2316058 [Mycena leptocephala]|nr:hypothetical protein B0H13DRAFT_2316058 [Mycena leptocephala]
MTTNLTFHHHSLLVSLDSPRSSNTDTMSLSSGHAQLPLELTISVLECMLRDEEDLRTLLVCSLVCQTWLSIIRPVLFKNIDVPLNKTRSFLEIMGSPLIRRGATMLTHIRKVHFHGPRRLVHV